MVIRDELIEELLAGKDPQKVFSSHGLLDELKKALAERTLGAEMDQHLAAGRAEKTVGDPRNHRNGYSRKTVLTGTGKLKLQGSRNRQASFEPQLFAKYRPHFPNFDEKIASLYARGMTVRDIQGHLRELYSIDVSPDLVSVVTDAVLEQVAEWQNRPLDTLYPLVFFDAVRVEIRDGEQDRRRRRRKPAQHRAQQGGLSCPGCAAGRHQGGPWPVDRADRGCQVLAACDE